VNERAWNQDWSNIGGKNTTRAGFEAGKRIEPLHRTHSPFLETRKWHTPQNVKKEQVGSERGIYGENPRNQQAGTEVEPERDWTTRIALKRRISIPHSF